MPDRVHLFAIYYATTRRYCSEYISFFSQSSRFLPECTFIGQSCIFKHNVKFVEFITKSTGIQSITRNESSILFSSYCLQNVFRRVINCVVKTDCTLTRRKSFREMTECANAQKNIKSLSQQI